MEQSSISSSSFTLVCPYSSIKLKRPPLVKFPKRLPSEVVTPRKPVYITADKTTCAQCPCFQKESPYMKPPRLLNCQQTPLTLYELAATVVDSIPLPEALQWSVDDVVRWLDEVVGLPQYKECFLVNHINGYNLPMLERPVVFALINIRIYDHIKLIITEVRKLYSLEFIKFSRSICLPPLLPGTHYTWFKTRTGPSWGIRQNWTRTDLLRWMKIIGPAPVHVDHWDMVWYEKLELPKTMFARIPPAAPREPIPMYREDNESTDEYLVPRKFPLQHTEEVQLIWMEGRQKRASEILKINEKKTRAKNNIMRLMPKAVSLEGLSGKKLLLARRLLPKQKFVK